MSPTGTRRPVRIVLTTVGAALAGAFALAAPAAAHLSTEPGAATVTGLTTDRAFATAAALVALAGAVFGGLALRAVRRSRGGRRSALAAVALTALGAVVGVIVVVTADGGLGTGNGIAGGYIAIVVGAVGAVLAGLALARGRS